MSTAYCLKKISYALVLSSIIGQFSWLSAKSTTVDLNTKKLDVIHLRANKQTIDLNEKTLTFSEDVYLEHDEFSLKSSELTCFPFVPGETNLLRFSMIATGGKRPVEFALELEGERATGSAHRIHYAGASRVLYMSGNIELRYSGHLLRAEQLEYHIPEKRIIAMAQNQSAPQLILRPLKNSALRARLHE